MNPKNVSKYATVNKIGGANMSQLNDVGNLVNILKSRNEDITLVVSAFIKVTNALISALDQLNEKDYSESDIDNAFLRVKDLHNRIIEQFLKPSKEKAEIAFTQGYEKLRTALIAHKQISKCLMPVEGSFGIRDQVIGFGEVMAGTFLQIYLEQEGHKAHFYDDVGCIGETFNGHDVSVSKLHRSMRNGIAESIKQGHADENTVKIFGGYISGTPHGIVPDVGRGYTDTSAVNVGIALQELQGNVKSTRFWKDVPGVLTGNPKNLNNAKNTPVRQPDISISEGLEMASAGSELMHIDALALAGENGIDLELRDIRSPDSDGTRYTNTEVITDHVFKSIITNPHIDTISIEISAMANRKGFISVITQVLEKHDLSIDGIFTEGINISFSIPMPQDSADKDARRENIREALAELRKLTVQGETFDVNRQNWRQGDLASIAIVGNEIRNNTGILSVITGILASYGIDIKSISHSENQRRITILIPHEKRAMAEQMLHSIFVDKDIEVIEDFRTRRAKIQEVLVSTYVK